MFTITSNAFEFKGKKQGDTVAVKELQDAGLNIEALVAGGHLSGNTKPNQVEGAAE